MFHPKTILCPTDFSEHFSVAFQTAEDLASQYQAVLLVLHVADTLGAEHLGFTEAATKLQPESHVTELSNRLKQIVPSRPGIEIRHILREGDAPSVINQVAGEHHCDLVVLGTHGRTWLDHLFMGSIAEKVLRMCPCAVLVIKYLKAKPIL